MSAKTSRWSFTIGVRLQASIDDKATGITIFPKVDSFVIVTFINKTTGYVGLYSDIDSIIIENESDSLKDILNDLIDAIRKITVNTPSGPSTLPLVNDVAFKNVDNKVNNLFKS